MYGFISNKMWKSYSISFFTFLMFALCLAIPNGYSVGPVLFLCAMLSCVFFVGKSPSKIKYNRLDYVLAFSFISYFMVFVAEIVIFGLKWREIDKPIRFLIAVPVIFFLLKIPARVNWLWAGIIIGSISAGSIGVYQKILLGLERASGFIYPIQFGDLAMLLGLLSLSGIAWGKEQSHRKTWIICFSIGACFGILASLLSGSRGGWIGAPLILLMLFYNYYNFLSRAQWTGIIVSALIGLATIIAIPETGVAHRIYRIYFDLIQYTHGNSNTSLGARLDLWRMSNYMFGHRPIFGYGSYDFVEMLSQLVEKFGYGHAIVAESLQSAHNEILDAAAKRGSIGVLALLGVYLVPLVLFSRFRKSRDMTTRSLALGGAMIPVCFMDFGMSQVLFTHNDAVMVYPYAIAVFWACLRNRQAQLRWTNSGFLPASK